MDKQIITFSANEQNLVRIGGEYHYSSNKVSYIGAHFDLGANWDGFDSVRAVWFTDRINGISTVLDGEGNCTVPTEVLKKKDRVFVNLVGSIVSNGELTDRLTTYPAVALVVDSKAKVDSTETAPVTPSQFEQFVSIVQDAVANIKDIVSTTLNADYTLTFVYSDGTSYTTPSIRGERGPQGADGADGTDGNGIASAILNSNYTLTLTFTDGTSYTTPSIRGAQGPKGDPGDVSQAQLDAAVSDLKSEISFLHSGNSETNNIGFCDSFYNGNINNGEYGSGIKYRVSNKNVIELADDVTILIADGFRAYFFLFESGIYKKAEGWITESYVVPKGTGFKVMIAEVTEDTSAVADIPTFVNALTFENIFVKNISAIESELGTATIEGYVRNYPQISGTTYANQMMGGSGNLVSVSGWNCLEIDIEQDEKYLITGTGNPLYVIKVDGSVVSYKSVDPASVTDYELTAPQDAKMYVNRNGAVAVVKHVAGFNFIKSGSDDTPIATKTGDTSYDIGNGYYVYSVDLAGSQNGLFNFTSLKRNGASFKGVSDDITPISFGGAGYVGANHGFFYGYDLTITAHGLTEADIGKTYNDGTNTWVLIKIVSENVIEIICYASTSWYRMKEATVPATVNFGTELTVGSSAQKQIRPCVINTNVEVVDNTHERCLIAESYDIIDIGVGIEYIKTHVGSNTNDSICDKSDGVVTVRNMYEFLNNGAVTIYQNLKMLKSVSLSFYGGVQSGSFTASTDYFAVPLTSFDYQAVGSTTKRFTRDTWDDNAQPPVMYLQTNESAGTKAMILGFLSDNRNADIDTGAGWVNGDGQKMYPYLINPNNVVSSGKVYNAVSFRLPCYLNEVDNNADYVSYTKVYEDYYAVIIVSSATDASITLPKQLWGKKAEVFMADGITVNTEYIVDSVDIISSGRGYLILKLTD